MKWTEEKDVMMMRLRLKEYFNTNLVVEREETCGMSWRKT